MLKLNRINLKLQDFENKYIKNKQKSVSISSTSDESISYDSKFPEAKSHVESETNGNVVKILREENEAIEPKHPDFSKMKTEIEPVVVNGHEDNLINNAFFEEIETPKIKYQPENRSNGNAGNFNHVDFTEILKKPRPHTNQSNTFDVLGNIRLITLDDLPDDSSGSGASGKNKRGDKIASAASFFQNGHRDKSSKESSLVSLNSDIKAFSNSNGSVSKEGTKMNGFNTESEIIEELMSPVSDIPEDISTALSDGILSAASEIKSEPKRGANKKGSPSGATNYDYSSEFEILSDVDRKQDSERLGSKSVYSNNKRLKSINLEVSDATIENVSELEQTQTHDQVSQNVEEQSHQSISGLLVEQSSESFSQKQSDSTQLKFHSWKEFGHSSKNKERRGGSKAEFLKRTNFGSDSSVIESDLDRKPHVFPESKPKDRREGIKAEFLKRANSGSDSSVVKSDFGRKLHVSPESKPKLRKAGVKAEFLKENSGSDSSVVKSDLDRKPHDSPEYKSSERKKNITSSLRDGEKSQRERIKHVSGAQNFKRISPDDENFKVAESLKTRKRRKHKIKRSSKNLTSENLNNITDPQRNGGIERLKSRFVKSAASVITNNKPSMIAIESREGKRGEVKRRPHIERIRHDISSESEIKNRNKIGDNVKSKQDFTCLVNIPGGEKDFKNVKSVNTQTSPKVVSFDEPPRFETSHESLFEEKFKTSAENICNCCARNRGCFRNSMNSLGKSKWRYY